MEELINNKDFEYAAAKYIIYEARRRNLAKKIDLLIAELASTTYPLFISNDQIDQAVNELRKKTAKLGDLDESLKETKDQINQFLTQAELSCL